jgi:branched-chain amino acid transport system permease protein
MDSTPSTAAPAPPAASSQRASLVRFWPLVLLVGLTTLCTLLAWLGDITIQQAATTALINMVLVVGLYVFVGNSGLFSFGHTAFMAIGAYVTALLAMPTDVKEFLLPELPQFIANMTMGTVPAILIGALAAMLIGAIVGLPIVRMQPLAASMATFAVLAIVFNFAQNTNAIGGSTGLGQVPVTTTLWSALAWAIVAIVLAFAYGQTRTALRLRAAREDEVAAAAVGVPVVRDRYVAFVLSAFIAGIAGGVFALNLGFFTPSAFFLTAAFLAVVMLVVGGMTSLSGAVVGVIAIGAIQELLRRGESGFALGPLDIPGRPGMQNVVLSLLLILVMVKRPLGIVGGREITWPFGSDDSPPEPDHEAEVGEGVPVAAAETSPAVPGLPASGQPSHQ